VQVDNSQHKRKCSTNDIKKSLSKEKDRKWSESHVIKKDSSMMKGEPKQKPLEKSNLSKATFEKSNPEKKCLVREM
jgi:hypothetical protein